jgi:hypothetical protein
MLVVPLCTKVHGITVNYKARPIHCIAREMRFTASSRKERTSMIHPLVQAAPVVLALLGVPNLAHALEGYGGYRGYGYPHRGYGDEGYNNNNYGYGRDN